MSQPVQTFETAPFADTFAKPEALMRVPVGFASPLWGLFAAAAMGGSAWWWMTRWAGPQNLEAMFGAASGPELALKAAETTVEIALEAEVSALEAAADELTAAQTVVEAAPLEAPVGGEAAPIAPAVAEAAPKPRVRKAEPKAE